MAAQLFDLIDDLTQDPDKRDAIEQGADFAWTLTFEAADTDATVAGDWLARMQVRSNLADDDGTAEPLVDIDSDTLGGITISIVPSGTTVTTTDGDVVLTYDTVRLDVAVDDTVTAGLPAGKWYYDLELVRLSDTFVRRIIKGRAQVVGEVTR